MTLGNFNLSYESSGWKSCPVAPDPRLEASLAWWQSNPSCEADHVSQQAAAAEIENQIFQFGQEEDQRLAAQMQPRDISVAEDETFHPQCCLVGIEPVSNFILLEQYTDRRDADTWDGCLDERLTGLPVNARNSPYCAPSVAGGEVQEMPCYAVFPGVFGTCGPLPEMHDVTDALWQFGF